MAPLNFARTSRASDLLRVARRALSSLALLLGSISLVLKHEKYLTRWRRRIHGFQLHAFLLAFQQNSTKFLVEQRAARRRVPRHLFGKHDAWNINELQKWQK